MSKKSLLAGKSEERGKIAAASEYRRTVANAEQKANETMSFKNKSDFMKKVEAQARKLYGMRVSFMASGDK